MDAVTMSEFYGTLVLLGLFALSGVWVMRKDIGIHLRKNRKARRCR